VCEFQFPGPQELFKFNPAQVPRSKLMEDLACYLITLTLPEDPEPLLDKGACGFNHQPGLPGDWSELCTCCLGQYIEGEDIVLLDLRVQEVCVVSMVEFPFFSFKVPFKTFNCKFHYTPWYEGVVI